MSLTVGSLFSGIGGFDLGFERSGMEIKWQVEIDPFCLKVLEKHWPHVERFNDIRTIDNIPYVDLICGGFPCQPISCAGNRKGDNDERWLWPEFYRIIRMVRPRWIVVENVIGLLSIQNGELFGQILRNLAESGYNAEWQVLSASDFGAPHLRKRIFVVGYSNGIRFSRKEKFFSQQHVNFPSDVPNKNKQLFRQIAERNSETWSGIAESPERTSEPIICGAFDGIPDRMDRLKSLGNAIVPQCAEYIGNCIMEFENEC